VCKKELDCAIKGPDQIKECIHRMNESSSYQRKVTYYKIKDPTSTEWARLQARKDFIYEKSETNI